MSAFSSLTITKRREMTRKSRERECPNETLGTDEGANGNKGRKATRAFQEIEYESEESTDMVHYRLFERLRP
jgi:hypothetical protein